MMFRLNSFAMNELHLGRVKIEPPAFRQSEATSPEPRGSRRTDLNDRAISFTQADKNDLAVNTGRTRRDNQTFFTRGKRSIRNKGNRGHDSSFF